ETGEDVGVQSTDLLDAHARAPRGLTHDLGPVDILCGCPVHDRRAVSFIVDLVVERGFRRAPLTGRDVLVPQGGSLVDVAVDVDDLGHQYPCGPVAARSAGSAGWEPWGNPLPRAPR